VQFEAVIFTRADKGNTTVALNKDVYIKNIEELLSDRNTYIVEKKNSALSIERKVNSLLKNWLQKDYISKKTYFSLHSSDSILPKVYRLPKIHKVNVPFKIIISSVNSTLYSLAAFIHNIIAGSITNNTSHINNSFKLFKSLSGLKISESDILISLDAVSLFTNIPFFFWLPEGNAVTHTWPGKARLCGTRPI